MPLSPAQPRRALHTRRYDFQVFARDDELWDIEGRIVDVKTYTFGNADRPSGQVAAGEPVHEMCVRLTVDNSLTVLEVEAVTDSAPYSVCPAVTPNFQRLVGIKIGPGWRNNIARRVGGNAGCTHIVEMLYAMATPAYQGVVPALQRRREEARRDRNVEDVRKDASWPSLLDSCHAYHHDGAIARRNWPQAAAEASDKAKQRLTEKD